MKDIFDYLDNNVPEYWWILLIIGTYLTWILFEWLYKLAIKYAFKECPRCKSQLPKSKVYADHCNACFDTTAEQFKQLFGKDVVMHDTGYEPQKEKP